MSFIYIYISLQIAFKFNWLNVGRFFIKVQEQSLMPIWRVNFQPELLLMSMTWANLNSNLGDTIDKFEQNSLNQYFREILLFKSGYI